MSHHPISEYQLKTITDILEKSGINYWIDYGTFLGAYRENQIIKHDTDIDVGIYGEKDFKKTLNILTKLRNTHNFISDILVGSTDDNMTSIDDYVPEYFTQIKIDTTQPIWIDFFLYKDIEENSDFIINEFLSSIEEPIYKSHIFPQSLYKLGKYYFQGPRNSHEYLMGRYGKKYTQTQKYTNILVDMCASIIHNGHIRLLENASKYGLVFVGLHTDEEIKKHKNIIPELTFEQRKEILMSIEYVEDVIEAPYVITNKFMDENNLDILVHGDDNTNEVSEERCLIFPRTESVSSSVIRQKASRNITI